MYLYCVVPYGKLKSNFIKVGICIKIESLNKRYITYYGSSFRSYYVKINDKCCEKVIHEKLTNLGLHLENELFIYNDIYDFYFYTQELNKFGNEIKTKNDKNNIMVLENQIGIIYNYKQLHIFEFIIYIFKTNTKENKINVYLKKSDLGWNYYKLLENDIKYNNFKKLWVYYLSFCNKEKQYFKTRNKLIEYIEAIGLNNNKLEYNKYEIKYKEDIIKIKTIEKIFFKEYILEKYNLIVDTKKKDKFEEYLNKNDVLDISRQDFQKMFINKSYYVNIKNVKSIKIKDFVISNKNMKIPDNKKYQIIKYYDLYNNILIWYNKNKSKKEKHDYILSLNEENKCYYKYCSNIKFDKDKYHCYIIYKN